MNSSYPSRALGGFCVLKRRNFEFDRLENRRKKGKKQTSSEAQTNAQKLSKREVKREIRGGVCFFCFCAPKHTSTLRASGIYCASSSFFSPTYKSLYTLCARRKITINIHTERGLRKERTFHDARNNTTVTRSRERLVSSFDFR